MLFAGYAEVPAFCANGFTPLRMPGAFALQKERARRRRAPSRRRAGTAPARAGAGAAARAAATAAPAAARRRRSPRRRADAAALLAQARTPGRPGRLRRRGAPACHAALAARPRRLRRRLFHAWHGQRMRSAHDRAPREYWRRCVYLQPDHYEALCHLALLAEQTAATRARPARSASAPRASLNACRQRDGRMTSTTTPATPTMRRLLEPDRRARRPELPQAGAA